VSWRGLSGGLSAADNRRMRPSLSALGTIVLGLAVSAAGGWRLADVSLTTAALFAAAAIVTELFEESARERLREPIESDRLQLTAAVQLAALLLLGPWVAALVAAIGVVASLAIRPRGVADVLFRAGACASATAAGGLAFRFAGGSVGALKLLDDLIPLAAAGLAYLTVRALLVDVLAGRESFDPRLRTTLGELSFGAAIALLALVHPWDVLVIVPLALVVHEAQANVARVQRETLRALETFANIVDERDPSTYRHSVRVAGYVDQLARALRLPFSDIDRLRLAGRLHDLGKVAVDSTVLRKPDRLDRDEWAAVRRHPRLSARLLQRFAFVATQARAVELHHERVDGRGYYGIPGDDLPLAAHFLIVADSFDAMTTDRPYRDGLTKEEALVEIERNLGTQFHPAVGKAFVAVHRGLDPTAVLDGDELAAIQSAHASYGLAAARGRALRERPELLALGGVVAALVAFAFDERWLAAAALAVAAVGAALRLLARARAERLASGVRAALHAPGRDELFDAVVACVDRAWPLEFSALLSWADDGLGGRIERRHGAATEENALVSWLVREAESGADVLVASLADAPRDGVTMALPLRRETSQIAGFIVLGGRSALPRTLELALLETLDELGLAIVDRPSSGGRGGADAEPRQAAANPNDLVVGRLDER
jgi:HD-GYP domain-containing protein (c-di-GMP phosphodiesterase class II)